VPATVLVLYRGRAPATRQAPHLVIDVGTQPRRGGEASMSLVATVAHCSRGHRGCTALPKLSRGSGSPRDGAVVTRGDGSASGRFDPVAEPLPAVDSLECPGSHDSKLRRTVAHPHPRPPPAPRGNAFTPFTRGKTVCRRARGWSASSNRGCRAGSRGGQTAPSGCARMLVLQLFPRRCRRPHEDRWPSELAASATAKSESPKEGPTGMHCEAPGAWLPR